MISNKNLGSENSVTADPFDLASLRLAQNFDERVGVKPIITTIPVRKPDRQWIFRVHSNESFRLQASLLEMRDDRETYIVANGLVPAISHELVSKILFFGITRHGVPFIWPVKLPGENGGLDSWNRSALEGAEIAQTRWVRIQSSTHLGAYQISTITAAIPEPTFPDLTFQQIIAIAFKDRLIDSLDHPVLKKLRGEIL